MYVRIQEYIFEWSPNIEVKRVCQFSCEDCVVLGMTFDFALNCGLYLLALRSSPLPSKWELLCNCCPLFTCVYPTVLWVTVCTCGRPVSSQFKSVIWRIKTSCELLLIFVLLAAFEILKVSPVLWFANIRYKCKANWVAVGSTIIHGDCYTYFYSNSYSGKKFIEHFETIFKF